MHIPGIHGTDPSAALSAGLRPSGGGDVSQLLDAMRQRRPDPDSALSDRGIEVGQLDNVAELLGTDAEGLAEQLGDDATFRDLMTAAEDAGAAPQEVIGALVSDVAPGAAGMLPFGPGGPGGFGGGGGFGGAGALSGMPAMLFDSAGDPTSSLLDLLGGDEDD